MLAGAEAFDTPLSLGGLLGFGLAVCWGMGTSRVLSVAVLEDLPTDLGLEFVVGWEIAPCSRPSCEVVRSTALGLAPLFSEPVLGFLVDGRVCGKSSKAGLLSGGPSRLGGSLG